MYFTMEFAWSCHMAMGANGANSAGRTGALRSGQLLPQPLLTAWAGGGGPESAILALQGKHCTMR